MAKNAAAPSEADAPRPWARAILHARIPAALKLVLLALFGLFTLRRTTARTLRALRQDWLFTSHSNLAEDLDHAGDPRVLRLICRLRALIGWLMRGTRNKGMAPFPRRAPEICPEQAARAPP